MRAFLPTAANDATGQEARDIARRTNEVLAEIVSRHPARFGAIATLPGLDAEGALAEIGYALDTLKLDGVTSERPLLLFLIIIRLCKCCCLARCGVEGVLPQVSEFMRHLSQLLATKRFP